MPETVAENVFDRSFTLLAFRRIFFGYGLPSGEEFFLAFLQGFLLFHFGFDEHV